MGARCALTAPGATSIGDDAFRGCTALTALPGAAADIGNYAFAHTSLTTVDATGLALGDGAFAGCTSLATLDNAPDTGIYHPSEETSLFFATLLCNWDWQPAIPPIRRPLHRLLGPGQRSQRGTCRGEGGLFLLAPAALSGVRLQKTLAFSLVFRCPGTPRAGRPRSDCPAAPLPPSHVRETGCEMFL